jgi:hypothetical protein
MAKCSRCGAETILFDSGTPICVRCDQLRKRGREGIVNALRERVEDARKRHAANVKFKDNVESVPSIPAPDSPHRIRQASNEFQDSLKELTEATHNLNEFLLHGTLPRGCNLRRKLDEGHVLHEQDTGHFKCPCGLRLTFGRETGTLGLLLNLRREENRKIGECPRCGRIHEVALPKTLTSHASH